MNYVKESVIPPPPPAEIIDFILLLIEVGVQQWTRGLKAHGKFISFFSGVLWQHLVWKQGTWLGVQLMKCLLQ